MMSSEECPALPFETPDILDIAPQYLELQAKRPVVRVRTLTGDLGWLITRHDHVRTLFAHPALGRSHPDPEHAARLSDGPILGGPASNVETEKADHARMRAAMAKSFAPRRVEQLRARVQAIVDELLDDMDGEGPPVDAHEALCYPLPVNVISEVLGVSHEDRHDFRQWSNGAINVRDPGHAVRSIDRLSAYMHALVDERRRRPGEDAISDMIQAESHGRLSAQEVVRFAVGLLIAGHETTVARLDFGVLLLLTHPEQGERLREDPSLITQAVEEVLRMAQPGLGLITRYAKEAISIDGHAIAAGDLVLLCHNAANRDPDAFEEADRFDITRAPNPHVAFGHGPRTCVGASLARLELQCALSTLFERFPTLRLAVSLDELRPRTDSLAGGLMSLPVAW